MEREKKREGERGEGEDGREEREKRREGRGRERVWAELRR